MNKTGKQGLFFVFAFLVGAALAEVLVTVATVAEGSRSKLASAKNVLKPVRANNSQQDGEL